MPVPTECCPKCGRLIPASAPRGLCPGCLVASVLDGVEDDGAATTWLPSPASPHERVGNYELLETLGRGGMGAVFRARDLRLNRIVALKLLLAGKLASDAEVKRFRTEAEAAAHLEHPNIVPIYEVGDGDGRHFLAMKFIEGGTLAGRISNSKFQIPNRDVAELLAKVARAVHHAHQHGILHRDLKPANVLLDENGEPFVTDFGLARRVETESHLTSSRDVLGTPAYLAPEVVAGGSREATTSSDVYSLGAIFYELLAGRPPFEADSVPALLRRIAEEEPVAPAKLRGKLRATSQTSQAVVERLQSKSAEASPPPRRTGVAPVSIRQSPGHEAARQVKAATDPSSRGVLKLETGATPVLQHDSGAVDRDLETICLKCLSKTPGDRYTSAQTLAEDLERWLRGEPILARPVSVWEQTLKWARRKPAWALVALLLLLAPVVVIGVLLTANVRVRRAQAETRENLYAADLQVAQTALEDANLGLARRILAAYVPRPGEPDQRGFEWRYLWQRAQSGALRVLRAHSQPIECVTFSPDGNWLASSEAGPVAWFWNTTTWKAERTIDWSGPLNPHFTWLSFSPAGKAVAVASVSGDVPIFDTQTMKSAFFLHSLLPPDGSLPRVLWSPVADKIAFLASDAGHSPVTAVLDWGAFQKNPGRSIPEGGSTLVEETEAEDGRGFPDAPMLRLPAAERLHSFTADGQLLANQSGGLVVFDVERGGAATAIPSAHRFDYCERSGDGRYLAGFNSTAKDKHSVLMDEFTPTLTNYWEMIGHEGAIRALAISPDSQRIVTGSADHTARVWDASTRKTLAILRGHSDEVTSVGWSPDGNLIATGSRDRTVMLWAASSTNLLDRSLSPLTNCFGPWVLSPDGAAVVANAGASNQLAVWNLDRRERVEFSSPSPIVPVFVAAGGGELLTVNGSITREVELRSWTVPARTSKVVRKFALPDAAEATPSASLWVMSADRRWLARGDERGTLSVWAVEGNAVMSEAGRAAVALAFSPDSRTLGVLRRELNGNGVVTFVSLGTEVAGPSPIQFTTGVNGIAWSPDGQVLAAACEDHTLQLWESSTHRLTRTLTGHKQGVTAVAFSPDNHTIASGDGRTIKLWQARTGRETLTVFRDIKLGDPLRWLAFTPDGSRLLAAAQTGWMQFFTAPLPAKTEAR